MSEWECVRHVFIRGDVQGVGFRAWTESRALARKIEGWVRNRRDGSVEAVFAGSSEDVTALVEACRQGPRVCRVDAVVQHEGDDGKLSLRRPGELFSVLATI